MPALAATEVEIAMTSGIASPRACGHEITRTVTVRSTAWSISPKAAQTTNVTHAGSHRDVEQRRRCSVGERLGPRFRRLRFRHEAPDARERRVLANRSDADPHGAIGRDRSSDHRVADALGDRLSTRR